MASITIDKLHEEIGRVFSFSEMPSIHELVIHDNGCYECEYLKSDLAERFGKEISGEMIRLLHKELSHLSAKAWLWILPYYLRYCLTEEAEYNHVETEFLIYNLSPSPEFELATSERLSMLSLDQIECVIHFLEWRSIDQYWQDIYGKDIQSAISYLSKVAKGSE